MMYRILLGLLTLPGLCAAQSMQATHAYSGLDATSAKIRIERGTPRSYGPIGEAAAMKLPPAMEIFAGLRLPGKDTDHRIEMPLIQRVRPTHRAIDHDLGINQSFDVVFFSEKQLVMIRLHVGLAEGAFIDRWKNQIRRLFDFHDRDRDGVLNPAEADFVFTNKGIQEMVSIGFAYPTPMELGRTFLDFDIDRDGRISFDEFLSYYQPSATGLLETNKQANVDQYATSLSQKMFDLLDGNRDGKLSRDEVHQLNKLFTTQDQDDDECLTPLELIPELFTSPPPAPVPAPADNMLVFPVGKLPENIAETLLQHYPPKQALKLTRKDHPFTQQTFQKLDRNGDGNISLTELVLLHQMRPDIEIDLVGPKDKSGGRVQIRQTQHWLNQYRWLWASQFRNAGQSVGILTLGTQTIHFNVDQFRLDVATARAAGQDQLGAFPVSNREYFTEKDIAGPNYQPLRVLFDTIDQNADGRVSRDEFGQFQQLQNSFMSLPLALVHRAQTPSMFQLMDENRDFRLSQREVRKGWDKLRALETTDPNLVTRNVLKPDGAIRLGRAIDLLALQSTQEYPLQTTPRREVVFPAWFQKLDKNGDGELSPREFPGTTNEFRDWDRNGDGGITPDEVEALRIDRNRPK